MLSVLVLYIPSFIGLVLVNWQLFVLLRIAKKQRSLATNFISGVMLGMTGVLASWFVVLRIAAELVNFGYPLLDYRVALLPIAWAIILFFINNSLRK